MKYYDLIDTIKADYGNMPQLALTSAASSIVYNYSCNNNAVYLNHTIKNKLQFEKLCSAFGIDNRHKAMILKHYCKLYEVDYQELKAYLSEIF